MGDTEYITLSYEPAIMARDMFMKSTSILVPTNRTVQVEHGISKTNTQNLTTASLSTAKPTVKELKDTHDAYSIYLHTCRLQPASAR